MGKTWFITGSSKGLGRALTEAVLASGDKVFATTRKSNSLADLKARYTDRIEVCELEITDYEATRMAIEKALNVFGGIDVVVNNAGYGNLNSIEDTSLEDFREQIETNLFGTINVTKAALPYFRKKRGGHFLQISSTGGRIGPIGRGAYAAAKWGIEGFSEVLAKETAPFGVKVTIIEPGGFRTEFAGLSTQISDGNPEYSETVGKTAQFQRDYNGRQPGDPKRAAAGMIQIANAVHPPLRFLMGSDAYAAVERNDMARLEDAAKWKELSLSTDFED